MCLLHFMSTWGRERGFSVTAAHFNHQLRGAEADRDESFVRDVCRRWEIPFAAGRGDVRAEAEREGLSPEEAARKLRYAFLKDTAARTGCARILTAHHADDNAETMLLNLVRGTGLRGLAGIPQERDGVLRPFLELSRRELEAYAAAHGLSHVEDGTNADPEAAARNLLRLRVMPLLREINPRAVEHMSAAAEILRAADSGMDQAAQEALSRAFVQPGRVTVSLDDLARVPEAALPRVLLGLFDLLGAGRKDVGAVHLEALRRLSETRGGSARISLPHGVTGCLEGRRLCLERPPRELRELPLEPGVPLRWGAYTLTLLAERSGEGLALRKKPEAGEDALCVGPVRPQDRLTLPETRGGARTVKRLCLDRGISLSQRDSLPAFYAEGRLAAVWPLGVDTQFLPEGEACRFIQIIKEDRGERL
jgi:tRNA(Ile)-lysidine synthase